MLYRKLVVLLTVVAVATAQTICDARNFGSDSFVCACSADYCDFLGTVETPTAGRFTSITSTRDGLRFHIDTGMISSTPVNATVLVHVNHAFEYQTMTGFGGAFTDATGINILSLPEATQEVLMRSYFSPEGLQYNLNRIPMGGSDFSTRPYTYDDIAGDVELRFFNLTEEDYNLKLPFIKKAMELSDQELYFFASPWSPPAWMKENGMHNGSGGLLEEMYQPYADYFVKFVQAYEGEGVPLWGLTTQNEPLTGFDDWPWNTCAFTAEQTRDWVMNNLGPSLSANDMRRLKLMILDHNRDALPWYPAACFEDPACSQYVDGVGLHWYADDWTGPSVIDETVSLFQDKFILYTESCDGWDASLEERVVLGAWWRGESYAYNMMEDFNHWSIGWVDWNMALDMQGGPNWANNYVDSPIIINKETGEFYKQPMFYAMGHFSKFIKRGAKRTYSNLSGSQLFRVAAFHNPDDNTSVITLLNFGDSAESVSLETGYGAGYINFDMPKKAIMTILLNTPAATEE